MRVIYTAVRSAVAVAVSFIFIDESRSNPVQVESDAGVIVMTATVEEIDVSRQIVTVIGPHGNILAVRVGPEHIHKVKLKEKVTVSYAEEVAVALRKYDGPPATDGRQFVEQAEAGMDLDPPTVAEQDWIETTPTGVVDHKTIEVTDTVDHINRNQRTITFKGTHGHTRTVRVPPSLDAEFSQIEKGDRVVVLITRAVAVDIKPI